VVELRITNWVNVAGCFTGSLRWGAQVGSAGGLAGFGWVGGFFRLLIPSSLMRPTFALRLSFLRLVLSPLFFWPSTRRRGWRDRAVDSFRPLLAPTLKTKFPPSFPAVDQFFHCFLFPFFHPPFYS